MSDLAGQQFWDRYHARQAGRTGMLARLSVLAADLRRLLRRHIRPAAKVLEIGFAPGGLLAWVARRLRAQVAGVDSSAVGVEAGRRLFQSQGVQADLRCEDVSRTTFAEGSFDLVYSAGLIEHFADPAPIVRKHVELTRPGGVALMAVPNYGGVYGRWQRRLDPENLAAHNLAIMSSDAMLALAPADLASRAEAFATGRLGGWLLSLRTRLPRPLGLPAVAAMHLLGRLQPCPIRGLESMLVLRIVRRR